MNLLNCHSTSASLFSKVPNLSSNNLISNLGPTSAISTPSLVLTYTCCLTLMKSPLFAKVITLSESFLGPALNKCFKIQTTLFPKAVVKLSNIRCGFTSLWLPAFIISCLITTLCKLNCAVGPCGKCDMVKEVGTPLCSCNTTKSVVPDFLQASTRFGIT
uniref:Uncharacterized protein n=1 Tax=Saccharomyces cerevisiae TaxID=4932 RepID=E9PA74_YEASX|nr:unknown [Saccharomyces cerevisiae]